MCISRVIFPNKADLEPVCERLWLILWQTGWAKCLVCSIRYWICFYSFVFFLKNWFCNVDIIPLQRRFAARISGHVTTWSHILQLCILWTMGNSYWQQVAKKNSRRKTTHPEASLYLNTQLDWLLNFAHHSKDCWSHLRSQYKDVALETGASKEGEGWMLFALWFCSLPLGKLDLVLCFCFVHVCTDVWSLSHRPVIENALCGPSSSYGVTCSFQWPLVSELIPQTPRRRKTPATLMKRLFFLSASNWG